MKSTIRIRTRLFTGGVVLALAGIGSVQVLAQETGQDQESTETQEGPEAEPPRVQELNPFAQDEQMSELTALFAEIELSLRRIDGLLLDASAGETEKLSKVEESGLERLLEEAPTEPGSEGSQAAEEPPADGLSGVLQRSEREGLTVLRGIDRVIEVAAQQSAQPSTSRPQDQGESPLDGQGQNRTGKTQGPQGPQEQPQSEQEGGEDPKGSKESQDPGQEQPTDQLPEQETEGAQPVDPSTESWGELPIHYRDIFRAEGGKGLPAEYRDWIDAYYRRLNQRSGG